MPLLTVSLALAGLALGVLPLEGAAGEWLRVVGLLLVLGFSWWRAGQLGAGLAARLALLLLVPALLLWGVVRQPQPGPADPVRLLPAAPMSAVPQQVRLRGTLVADPRPRGDQGGCSAVLEQTGGRTELLWRQCPAVQQGWRLEVDGLLRRPASGPHPLLSGPAERLARQGIWSQLRLEDPPTVLERPAPPIAEVRRRMAAALLASGGPERGGVLAALVLGSAVVPLPAEVREAFRAAGLSHALAASGFHLTVLLGAVMALGRRLPRPPRAALAIGAMLLFLLLAGPQPSVVRAVLMGGVAFAVLEGGGRSRPLGVLLLSVLVMLLVRPNWLLDVGFQLSVAATAGLILTASDLEQALQRWLPAGEGSGWIGAGLAVPVAASLWTLPLQLLHFGVVPLYAVPANLVVAPLLTPLTLGAMAMALCAVTLPALLPLLAWPLGALCGLLLLLVRGFAALPMAQWQVGRPIPWLVLLLFLSLLPWLLQGQRWRRLGLAGLGLTLALHLSLLGADRLLLVHQWGGDLLLARHRGRGALISLRADGLSCSSAARLATGLGLSRYDWIALLDPVASDEHACWQQQSPLVLAASEGRAPLLPGQRLESPGLALTPLSADSHAHVLTVGSHRWLLLPDRQSLLAWQQQLGPEAGPGSDRADGWSGTWLGFQPWPLERQAVAAAAPRRLWVSGEWPDAPSGWQASGGSGALDSPAG
ncbi:ComEC/Rec2 family competence protein [Synechococcus sp. CS-602]|uniref:ComEC/Rec2 family competence protein n=1 Tax=Synechococcaceae TaxID=1890426 RepID=UPI0008FF74A5|nr:MULTISPECIES: ComEC/Rec2 family competence protein [Synechococcaceae]MCT4365426.1 ComEC/Rec2 family competence protein [Candidatus Regnicoccus frigidus MAG-AL1]APD47537.1 competence protein ComEC [Synechococcus sp. SynAce01]MCT0202491.1 ComEC/Rec2 family competence protein [Synechococcus sp. CS-603]MCT0204296.1 ComEC/Rec2 family competence protein [Synechococcus sp. CS-602]MCT0247138.1 ComEC/Rec2 family competence protein [Synechococcus sp. CS-601]